MTAEQKKARRRVIVKRNAARKISDTWARKRGRGRPRKDESADPVDDSVSLPDTDTMLDELPESLVG